MTTIVTVKAHCRDALRVRILAIDRHAEPEMRNELARLKNGEEYTAHATDTRTIEVSEVWAVEGEGEGL